MFLIFGETKIFVTSRKSTVEVFTPTPIRVVRVMIRVRLRVRHRVISLHMALALT